MLAAFPFQDTKYPSRINLNAKGATFRTLLSPCRKLVIVTLAEPNVCIALANTIADLMSI
jgi:hypothetical protein